MHRAMRFPVTVLGAAAGLGCLMLAVGLSFVDVSGGRAVSGSPVPAVSRGQLPDSDVGMPVGVTAKEAVTAPRHSSRWSGEIQRLNLTRLGVAASVVPVTAPGGIMQIPQDPRTVGWWSGGASPGGGRGSVVLVGHINYHGKSGALGVLADTLPGDVVVVSSSSGTALRYVIRAVRTYPKSIGLPQQIFSRDGPEQLVLITCGGPFDPSTGNYEDNIVAYATSTS